MGVAVDQSRKVVNVYCILVRGPSRSGANHLSSSGKWIWDRGSIRFLSLEVDRAAGTVGGMDPLRRWALLLQLVVLVLIFRSGEEVRVDRGFRGLRGSSVGMNRVALLNKGIRPGINPTSKCMGMIWVGSI